MITILVIILAAPLVIRILDILLASAVHAVIETTMPSKPKSASTPVKTSDRVESLGQEV